MKNCPECGSLNIDDAKKCDACGYEFVRANRAPSLSTRTHVSRSYGSEAGGFCLTFFLGIIGALVVMCINLPLTTEGAKKGIITNLIISGVLTIILLIVYGSFLSQLM